MRAALALESLARHRGVSRRELVESLLLAAEADTLRTMSAAERRAYLADPSVTR